MSRAVLVTGSSRGIGAAVARAFAVAGDRVAVHCGNSLEAGEAVLGSLAGSGHTLVQAELTDPVAVTWMVNDAASALGGLDVLVNNAGIYQRNDIDENDYLTWQRAWQEVLDVNLLAAANAIWCAVRHMKRGGRIVNISSRGAFRGEPQHLSYGASKAALNSLTQSLAQYLAPRGISVTALAPGYVKTDMAEEYLAGPEGDVIRAQSPFRRVARVEEVAQAVLFLAAADVEFISGAILDINGASYLRS